MVSFFIREKIIQYYERKRGIIMKKLLVALLTMVALVVLGVVVINNNTETEVSVESYSVEDLAAKYASEGLGLDDYEIMMVETESDEDIEFLVSYGKDKCKYVTVSKSYVQNLE